MYYLIFLYLLALYFLRDKLFTKESSGGLQTVSAMLPILLISIFRYGVGADYFSYNYIYEMISSKSFLDVLTEFPNIDVGFLLIMKHFLSFNLSYQTFIVVLSITQIILVGVWIFRNSRNIILSIIVYYTMFLFVWNFSALRQGLVLSIILLLLFDKKKKSLFQECLGIALLSTIHSSALILYLCLIIRNIEFTKKSISVLFVFSVIFSLLPLHFVLSPFQSISIVGRLLEYTAGGGYKHLLSFPSIARIAIFTGTIIFYESITIHDYEKKMVDLFLCGFIIYFMLSFAPIAAGRFAIYFYFLSVLVFPLISVQGKFNTIKLKHVSIYINVMLFIFLGASFLKEINTMALQTGYLKENKIVSYTSIFNKNNEKFKTIYSFLIGKHKEETARHKKFISEETKIKNNLIKPSPEDSFYSVLSNTMGGYIIINQDGERVSNFVSSVRTPIYDDIIEKYNIYEGFPVSQFENIITGESLEKEYVSPHLVDSFYKSKEFPVYKKIEFENLDMKILELFEYEDEITSIDQQWFVDSMYYIYEITYLGIPYVVYTDLDNNPYVTNLISSQNRIINNQFIISEGINTIEYYNFNDELIWVENKEYLK